MARSTSSSIPGVVTARESTSNLPAGLLVAADHAAIAAAFGAVAALQPVRWTAEGLLCAPRLAPQGAWDAIARCPLPTRPAPGVRSAFPDSPAEFVAGWYRRTDHHAPAPDGVRELIQVAGDAFGPAGHPTTAMCLACLDGLQQARGVDVGCGSGLLTQAWVRLHDVPVLAVDLDPAAIRQTVASLAAAGTVGGVRAVRGPVGSIAPDELAGAVVFANVPLPAHQSLLDRIDHPPAAVVASGLRPSAAADIVAAYRQRGLRHVRALRRSGFDCHVLVAA